MPASALKLCPQSQSMLYFLFSHRISLLFIAYDTHMSVTQIQQTQLKASVWVCVCVWVGCEYVRWNFPLFTPQIWLKSKSSIIKLFPLDWCLLINYTTHNILITSIIVSDGSCSDKPKACQSLGPRTSSAAHSQLAPKEPVALRQYCNWFDWNPKGVPIENTLKGFLFINIQTCHLTP